MGLSKAQFQYVEDELRRYHETKQHLEELRLNVITGSIYQEYRDDNTGGTRPDQISKPTEQRAAILDMDNQIQHMNRVVRAIEKTISKLEDNDKTIIALRYWANRRNTWDHIARKAYTSRITAIRHRDLIIREIARNLGFKI